MPDSLHSWRARPWRLLLLMSGALYLFIALYGLFPGVLWLWKERNLLMAQQAQLDQMQDWAGAEPSVSARIAAMQRFLEKAQTSAGSGGRMEGVLHPLVSAAQRAGLTVTGIATDGAVQEKGRQRWVVHIQAAGRYHQVGMFVDALEQDPALMVLESLELSAPDMSQPEVMLRLDVTRYEWQPPGVLP